MGQEANVADISAEVTLVVSEEFVSAEGKNMVTVYCPELDMGGMGTTREEAEKQFHKSLKMNVVMAKAQKALEPTLTSFNWTKKDGQWMPPQLKMSVEKITVTL